ncbi:modulatory calcineurin-interacting protein [Dictyostelium discoideum AX4]|uniref:Modulatory calcineurin-interacting protein n=1 Tax=Dictyostelium discoideum TaxID=44689 RepID=Q86JH9_DICDI|nr:modulatory calcineurin-interacting protein [Dictyostelium discoideum AX4]EAL71632.1 modulatory calcineurin-interacting protein [Dictyostelium discoideum AX4]|eukprot:XP_645572.1 modulatory calcineurin-interacting protein [Dictyostelium discoideum AX4]
MSKLESELAKLILENNKAKGIDSSNSLGPPSITFGDKSNSFIGTTKTNINSIGNNSSGSSSKSLNVPSIVVSCDNENSNSNFNKGCCFNVNNNNNNNSNLFNDKKQQQQQQGPSPSPSPPSPSSLSTSPNCKSNFSSCSDSGSNDKEALIYQMRQKKIKSLERREPSNVLIIENISEKNAQLVQLLVEDQNLNFSFSVQLIRYLSHFKSLILVFSHRNEAELCKLLVSRQDSIKLDVDTILYFGKEISIGSIGKYQLTTPFATRQHLISPPLSPPNEWSAPGDGMEHPPTDVDPFAVVTRVVIDENDDENFSFGGNNKNDNNDNDNNNKNKNNNNNNGGCNDSESETPSSSLVGFSTNSRNSSNNSESTFVNSLDPEQLSDRLRKVIYQDNTSNGFPSITLEFCT